MKQALRRNEGYILPYVLIVFLVLSFAAVTICGISLNNLRAQEDSVKRTQALYEAEGKIEEFTGELAVLKKGETEAELFTAALADGFVTGVEASREEPEPNVLTVIATSGDGTVTVEAQIVVTVKEPQEGSSDLAEVSKLEYTAYSITHSTEEGGGGS